MIFEKKQVILEQKRFQQEKNGKRRFLKKVENLTKYILASVKQPNNFKIGEAKSLNLSNSQTPKLSESQKAKNKGRP